MHEVKGMHKSQAAETFSDLFRGWIRWLMATRATHIFGSGHYGMLGKESRDATIWHPLAGKTHRENIGNANERNDVWMTKASPSNHFEPESLHHNVLSARLIDMVLNITLASQL
jgi:hypothetical protein